MSEHVHPYERIEQYLAGKLDADVRTAFEKQMTTDSNLSEEVALHRDLQDALAEEEVMELEQLLISMRTGGQQTNIKPLWSRKPYLSVAAAILFICVLAFLFWPGNQSSEYVAYFDTYPLYVSTRSAETNYDQQLNLLDQSYKKGDYEQALSSLNQLRESQPEDKALQFYQAYCQYELGFWSKAEAAFMDILTEGDSAYLSPAEWYLVDVYLKQNKQDQALALLQQIRDKEGDYSQLASQLLEELN